MKQHIQEKLRILIADSDLQIARVIQHSLEAMHIKNVALVRNGVEAVDYIREKPVDILICEWLMSPVDGIELVKYLRQDKNSPNRTLPIVMLTGKGEKHDVEFARDAGITEFLVKPFTTKMLFDRIEQLVDNPRGFVLAPDYKGPDRRRREARAEGERRGSAPRNVQPQPGVSEREFAEPVMIMPDHVLKRTMGLPTKLSTVITTAMVADAQKVIDNMQGESLGWIREDLTALENNHKLMMSEPRPQFQEEMERAAMSIKARAGTFGHMLTSNIARLLHIFLTTGYERWKVIHNQIVQKHIEAMKVAIATNPDMHKDIGPELLKELERLIGQQSS